MVQCTLFGTGSSCPLSHDSNIMINDDFYSSD